MPEPEKPVIEYPCPWSYRLIGRQALEVRAAVATILGLKRYVLNDANTSSGGKYRSFELALIVDSESERQGLFKRLADHADIIFVL